MPSFVLDYVNPVQPLKTFTEKDFEPNGFDGELRYINFKPLGIPYSVRYLLNTLTTATPTSIIDLLRLRLIPAYIEYLEAKKVRYQNLTDKLNADLGENEDPIVLKTFGRIPVPVTELIDLVINDYQISISGNLNPLGRRFSSNVALSLSSGSSSFGSSIIDPNLLSVALSVSGSPRRGLGDRTTKYSINGVSKQYTYPDLENDPEETITINGAEGNYLEISTTNSLTGSLSTHSLLRPPSRPISNIDSRVGTESVYLRLSQLPDGTVQTPRQITKAISSDLTVDFVKHTLATKLVAPVYDNLGYNTVIPSPAGTNNSSIVDPRDSHYSPFRISLPNGPTVCYENPNYENPDKIKYLLGDTPVLFNSVTLEAMLPNLRKAYVFSYYLNYGVQVPLITGVQNTKALFFNFSQLLNQTGSVYRNYKFDRVPGGYVETDEIEGVRIANEYTSLNDTKGLIKVQLPSYRNSAYAVHSLDDVGFIGSTNGSHFRLGYINSPLNQKSAGTIASDKFPTELSLERSFTSQNVRTVYYIRSFDEINLNYTDPIIHRVVSTLDSTTNNFGQTTVRTGSTEQTFTHEFRFILDPDFDERLSGNFTFFLEVKKTVINETSWETTFDNPFASGNPQNNIRSSFEQGTYSIEAERTEYYKIQLINGSLRYPFGPFLFNRTGPYTVDLKNIQTFSGSTTTNRLNSDPEVSEWDESVNYVQPDEESWESLTEEELYETLISEIPNDSFLPVSPEIYNYPLYFYSKTPQEFYNDPSIKIQVRSSFTNVVPNGLAVLVARNIIPIDFVFVESIWASPPGIEREDLLTFNFRITDNTFYDSP